MNLSNIWKKENNLIWAWKKQNRSYKDFLNTTQRWQTRSKFIEISNEMMEWNCRTNLKTYLDKLALQAIEGFPLTSENYTEARNLLNDRYGNKQYIIVGQMKKLVKLEPVIHPGVKDLRKFYNTVESHVRSLERLGINYRHFSSLLIPIILERLPNMIKLQISPKLRKKIGI